MPWWDPDWLSGEEAWQTTAYVLKLQKVMPMDFVLGESNASAIPTQQAVPHPGDDRPAVLVLIGLLALSGDVLLPPGAGAHVGHG